MNRLYELNSALQLTFYGTGKISAKYMDQVQDFPIDKTPDEMFVEIYIWARILEGSK